MSMTESKEKLRVIAEDCKAVIEEAKSMGCNKVRALYNIPLENMELIVQALEKQISKKSILMGDLISRSELLKQLETKPKNSTVPKEVKLKDLITYYHEKVIEVIEDMPTAYDVDKVVEELDNRSVFARPVGWSKSYELITLKNAVEVVKQGGVSDDVCEWHKVKNGNAYKCNTHAEIHDARVLDWCRCPYCGKKLKAGGEND